MLGMALAVQAQTNTMPSFTAAIDLLGKTIENSTNYAVVFGYGHSITGTGKNLGFGEVAYNFNPYVGLALGYDALWGNKQHQFNSLSGGVTLQMKVHPFAFIGSTFLTNVVCTPIAFDQVATSKASTVANIIGAGVDFDAFNFSNWGLHLGIDYEKRTGDPVWDAEYVLGHIALSRNF